MEPKQDTDRRNTLTAWCKDDLIERVLKLENMVVIYKHRHETTGPLSVAWPDSCRCSACDAARAVLAERE